MEIKCEPISQYDEKTVEPFIKTYLEGVANAAAMESATKQHS
nr:MAG TPA: hypothetical protein [Caudoviricetes sp.]